MSDSGRSSRASVVAMVATTPLIAFWLIGYGFAGEDEEDEDYLVRVSIDHTTMLAIGITATVIFVVAARYSYVHRRATPNTRVVQLVALVMLAGLLLAWGFRAVIAGVNGANIGGVFFLTMGLPLCAGLVVFAIVRYRRAGP